MHCVRRLVYLINSSPLRCNKVTFYKRQVCAGQDITSRFRHQSFESHDGTLESRDEVNKVRDKVSKVQDEISKVKDEAVESHNESFKSQVLEDEIYNELSSQCLGVVIGGHRVIILQPYVKWGAKKRRNTTQELQLAESIALINTLPDWVVVDTMFAPLLHFDKRELLGKGNLEIFQKKVKNGNNITAVFVNIDCLKYSQVLELQRLLHVQVYDRYAIVIHIFRIHAKTHEAKLQVALAEMPYIMTKLNVLTTRRDGAINMLDNRRKFIGMRESKLKAALLKLRTQRELIRTKRKAYNIPSVAVVGYTNAGKTSLIKALTGDAAMEPKDHLFATLDTTVHEGLLPSKVKVLFVDTIGFIQDVPTALIEPFKTTLADAINADVIVHIFDANHPDKRAQIEHVEETIQSMITENQPVITVANKCDLGVKEDIPEDIFCVSAVHSTGKSLVKLRSEVSIVGIDLLRKQIEKELLAATGRSMIRIRVESGSSAASWLYRETAVVNVEADQNNVQYLLMDVITTELQLIKFRQFLRQQL